MKQLLSNASLTTNIGYCWAPRNTDTLSVTYIDAEVVLTGRCFLHRPIFAAVNVNDESLVHVSNEIDKAVAQYRHHGLRLAFCMIKCDAPYRLIA